MKELKVGDKVRTDMDVLTVDDETLEPNTVAPKGSEGEVVDINTVGKITIYVVKFNDVNVIYPINADNPDMGTIDHLKVIG
jgi:hypothetical protein